MAADLTVDNLLAAMKFFFRQIVDNPDQPVDQKNGIILYGTPADDDMRALMEAFGGTIKITVKEVHADLSKGLMENLAAGQGAVLWSPSEEPPEEVVSGEVEWFSKSPRPEVAQG